jgi:membrane protein implicated in regulation of membrane protease activity
VLATRHNRRVGSWVLWTIIAAAFTLGELHTNSFYLAPFAVGGAIAAVLAAAGAGAAVSIIAFVAAAILFLLLLRPLAVRRRRGVPTLRTGAAALVGQPALVLERIANREGVGTVRIGGEVWTARSYDQDQVIAAGEEVEVVEIRGATALVMP